MSPGWDRALRERMLAASDSKNWLSFSDFMHLALHAPGLGYYSRGDQQFGTDGDFITASDHGTLFAACLAKQFSQVLAAFSRPCIMELGPGTGTFAAHTLQYLNQLDCQLSTYYLVEPSAALRQRQHAELKKLVPQCLDRVQWLDSPNEVQYEGVLFANEVVDALGCKCFELAEGKVWERGVDLSAAMPKWKIRPAPERMSKLVETLLTDSWRDWAGRYRSEYQHMLEQWLATVTSGLTKGAAIFVDYGFERKSYYHAQRTEGTLRCFHRHQVNADPFQHIGNQDITASVDFTRMAEGLELAGMAHAGFALQRTFLSNCGLTDRIAELSGGALRSEVEILAAAQRLVHPNEMGDTFKVIAATRGLDRSLLGFSRGDISYLL